MKNPYVRLGAGFLFLLALAIPGTLGDEGRIPVWQPIVIGPGGEGRYIVTRDVMANPGLPVIDVQPGTVAVDIDLNGFTLYGIDTDVIRASVVDSLTIRNGVIMSGQDGINATDCRKVVVEDVKVEFVRGIGIHLTSVENFALRRNIVVSDQLVPAPTMMGIFVDGTPAAEPLEGTIEGNQIEETGTGIMVRVGSSVSIRNNRLDEIWGGDAIHVGVCDGCLVAENTVEHVVGNGIAIVQANVCKVHNNVVFGCENDGFLLDASFCLVLDNVAGLNGHNGMTVSGFRNQVERNVLDFNNAFGLHFPPVNDPNNLADNTFGRNTARGNGQLAPPPCMFVPPVMICTAPYGGGLFPPDICNESLGNTSFCDNLMPGPPLS